jgi:hypothetical protein
MEWRAACSCLLVAGLFSATLDAMSITDRTFAFDNVITFDEISFANNKWITTEFSQYGVTFSPLQYFTLTPPSTNWGGIKGGILYDGAGDESFPTITITFASPVSAAGFSFRAGDATRQPDMLFVALLNGSQVEAFTSRVTTSQDLLPEQFFGFKDIVFDQITVDMLNVVNGPPCCGSNLDNLSFSAAVPLPAAGGSLAAALAVLACIRRNGGKLNGCGSILVTRRTFLPREPFPCKVSTNPG